MFCTGNVKLQIFALDGFVKTCPVGLTDSYIYIYIYVSLCVCVYVCVHARACVYVLRIISPKKTLLCMNTYDEIFCMKSSCTK